MALVNAKVAISLVAAADLSANQFRFVNVDANGQTIAITGIGERMVGLQEDKPGEATAAAGEVSEVSISGVVKVIAGATVTAGQEVKSDASGRAIDATARVATHFVAGTALTGGAVGELISVLISKYQQAV